MIKNITYEDKEAIQNDTTIPDKNKVTASDMNEIKQAINENAEELKQNKKNTTLNAENIEELQNKDNEHDEKIEQMEEMYNLQEAELEELRIENKRLRDDLNSSVVTSEESGENITLADSSDCRFKKLEIGGNSKQDGEPSIDNPVEVKTVKDNVNIVVDNKNLEKKINDYKWSSNSNATIEKINDFIKITPTENKYSGMYNLESIKNIFELIKNKKVMISFRAKADSNRTLLLLENYTFNLTNDWQTFSHNFIFNAIRSITFYGGDSVSTVPFYIKDLQVEIADNVTDYEEHKEQTYTMPVQNEMLEGDCLDLENSKEVHSWNKIILDGSDDEKWIKHADVSNVFYQATGTLQDLLTSIEEGKNKCLSNRLKFNGIIVSSSEMTEDGLYLIKSSGKVLKRLNIRHSEDLSLAEFKTWLSENPVTVYYKTETLTETAFTEEQKAIAKQIIETAHSYKGVTHIYTTDETKAILNVEYIKDLNTIINNLQAQILAE